MVTIHVIAWVSLLVMAVAVLQMNKLPHICNRWTLIAVFAAALALRCVLGYTILGFEIDLGSFSTWGIRACLDGFGSLYTSGTDYPPVYLYVLALIGGCLEYFDLAWFSGVGRLLLKLPAICCDVVTGGLLFAVSSKHLSKDQSLLLTVLYLFNPAIILDSAVWGQVDTILAFEVVVMCLCLSAGCMPAAYAAFGIGILTKPQMAIFTPLLLLGIWERVFAHDFSWKKFFRNLFSGLAVIGLMALICVPFGVRQTIETFLQTLDSYKMAAQNASNFWTLMGFNMDSQDEKFLLLTCRQWGIVAIVLTVLLTVVLFVRLRENAARYFICAAFLMSFVFLFAVRQHERYMYPVLTLLAFSYAFKPNRNRLLNYVFFTFTQFYNIGWMLAVIYWDTGTYDASSPVLIAISAASILAGAWFAYALVKEIRKDGMPQQNIRNIAA